MGRARRVRGHRWRARALAAAFGLVAGLVGVARAEDGPPVGGGPAASEEPPTPHAPRSEVAILPAVAYDSALGVGFGVVANVVRLHPEFSPYKALLDGQIFLYLGPRPGGGVRVPLQNHWVRLDLPGRLGGALRLRVRLGVRSQINVGYYGMGNASQNQRPWLAFDRRTEPDAYAAARRRYEYTLTQPDLSVEGLLPLRGALQLWTAARAWWSFPEAPVGSKLADDLGGMAGADVVRLLAAPRRHGVVEAAVGLVHDTRDHELAPQRGGLHELSVRGGPTIEVAGGYGGVHLQTRVWAPLVEHRLVVGARFLLDALFGRPPFSELARFGGRNPEFGPGGAMSVRGVPWQRYHGKIKAIGNLELRAILLRTRVLKRPAALGVLGFFDLGRVWSEWRANPTLDGEALGLKVGLGGGLRLHWGETFIVRGDVAWSPDGLGVTFDVNHIF